nr:heat shock protein 70 [Hymenolepis microstoma]
MTRPMLHIPLHNAIIESTTNETLGIEHGVGRVHSHLVLGSITDQPLGVCEANITGGSAIALVISYNFHLAMLEHTNTREGRSQIDTNSEPFRHQFQY